MNKEGTSLVAQWQDSTCHWGCVGLVSGLGTSPSMLQLKVFMLGFLVAQLVKNPPAMQETPV